MDTYMDTYMDTHIYLFIHQSSTIESCININRVDRPPLAYLLAYFSLAYSAPQLGAKAALTSLSRDVGPIPHIPSHDLVAWCASLGSSLLLERRAPPLEFSRPNGTSKAIKPIAKGTIWGSDALTCTRNIDKHAKWQPAQTSAQGFQGRHCEVQQDHVCLLSCR